MVVPVNFKTIKSFTPLYFEKRLYKYRTHNELRFTDLILQASRWNCLFAYAKSMSEENALKVRQIPHSAYLMKKLTVHSDANETTKRNINAPKVTLPYLIWLMRKNESMMSSSGWCGAAITNLIVPSRHSGVNAAQVFNLTGREDRRRQYLLFSRWRKITEWMHTHTHVCNYVKILY